MSVSKTAVTVTSLAFALMFGGGALVLMNLGSIAEQITERLASETLGVSVDIGSMDVRLADKIIEAKNVQVSNPEGYSKPHAAKIENIKLQAQTLSDVLLEFKDVEITGAEFFMEVRPTGTNIMDIRRRVNSNAAAGDKAAQQIKVIIDHMNWQNTVIHPSVVLMSGQDLKPVTIPQIKVNSVGRNENGVLASEAIAQIWESIAVQVAQHANSAGFYEGLSPETLKDIGVGHIEVIKDQIKDAIDNLGKDLESLVEE